MSTVVDEANKASSTELILALDNLNITHAIRVLHSKELIGVEKNAIWKMFEENMQNLYRQSSFGWDPLSKRAELFHSLSRFVLIGADNANDTDLVAFTMFRFEHDEGKNILYCYDLQVQRNHQRAGQGRLLMQILESIGTAWRMEKVVLTVFKANRSAVKFYQAFGFSTDETSPGYIEEVDAVGDKEGVDYEILSKQFVF